MPRSLDGERMYAKFHILLMRRVRHSCGSVPLGKAPEPKYVSSVLQRIRRYTDSLPDYKLFNEINNNPCVCWQIVCSPYVCIHTCSVLGVCVYVREWELNGMARFFLICALHWRQRVDVGVCVVCHSPTLWNLFWCFCARDVNNELWLEHTQSVPTATKWKDSHSWYTLHKHT